MEWEILELIGSQGGILILSNTRTCLANEVVWGNFSIIISFLDSEGEELWVNEVYGPLKPREGRLSGRSWETFMLIAVHIGVWLEISMWFHLQRRSLGKDN